MFAFRRRDRFGATGAAKAAREYAATVPQESLVWPHALIARYPQTIVRDLHPTPLYCVVNTVLGADGSVELATRVTAANVERPGTLLPGPFEEARFALGHCLAHLILHRVPEEVRNGTQSQRLACGTAFAWHYSDHVDAQERLCRQADDFASYLLINSTQLRERWRALFIDEEKLYVEEQLAIAADSSWDDFVMAVGGIPGAPTDAEARRAIAAAIAVDVMAPIAVTEARLRETGLISTFRRSDPHPQDYSVQHACGHTENYCGVETDDQARWRAGSHHRDICPRCASQGRGLPEALTPWLRGSAADRAGARLAISEFVALFESEVIRYRLGDPEKVVRSALERFASIDEHRHAHFWIHADLARLVDDELGNAPAGGHEDG